MANLISIRNVTKKISLSRNIIWRLIERKEFPAPVSLTEVRRAFVLNWVNGWLAQRAALRGVAV